MPKVQFYSYETRKIYHHCTFFCFSEISVTMHHLSDSPVLVVFLDIWKQGLAWLASLLC
jgi:hypothetical protein